MHTIRLRGPWEYQLLPSNSSAGGDSTAMEPTGKTQLPIGGQFLGNDFRGTVRLVRRFGKPTNLEPAERVELVIEHTGELHAATLNGQRLDGSTPVPERVDITPHLLPRNELVIEVVLLDEFRITDVRLEIHDS